MWQIPGYVEAPALLRRLCVASDLIRLNFLVPARRIVSLGVSPEVEAARLIKSSTTPYGAKRRKAC